MEENKEDFLAKEQVNGLAAHILQEVIKADMSMHQAQVDAWRKFGEYRPQGNLVNPDIHIGFAERRYLCLNEVKLSFHIKPHSKRFFQRIKLAFSVLRGKNGLSLHSPTIFDIATPNDKDSMHFEINVKRFENGTVKAEYKPTDSVTKDLLNEVKL
ncbi:MAG: hypothetical protein AB7S54_00350 [Bacteroidales bacterium]